jgi:2-polyprenyl-3-methyl-5-hydroxy-6-metoxy-1,4-benzoquinol methylase
MTQKPCIYRNKAELIQKSIPNNAVVLDVGFWGQGVTKGDTNWPHALLKVTGAQVYGVDLNINRGEFPDTDRYQEGSAEDFSFPGVTFTHIFAGDLIEHLPNPGKFLEACARHMNTESQLILTTPNCFNLFNLTEKLSKDEPTVNADHTMYFNHKTLRVLLQKCGFNIQSIDYIYSLEYTHKESWKKRLQNILYYLLSTQTPKFVETLVVIARPAQSFESPSLYLR